MYTSPPLRSAGREDVLHPARREDFARRPGVFGSDEKVGVEGRALRFDAVALMLPAQDPRVFGQAHLAGKRPAEVTDEPTGP